MEGHIMPADTNLSRHYFQIGVSQLIRLEWLRYTANLVLANYDKKAIKESLEELLKDKVSKGGNAERGNRKKIITILMKVWVNPLPDLSNFRREGLELLKNQPFKYQLIIHWGMMLAVYPFWGYVASQVGRLLRLQDSFSVSQLQRRLREAYGERQTVFQAARRVLRSYVDWGVLEKTEMLGIYRQGEKLILKDEAVAAWLLEAQLRSQPDGKSTLSSLTSSPCLFPIVQFPSLGIGIEKYWDRIDTVSVDMNDYLLMLKTSRHS